MKLLPNIMGLIVAHPLVTGLGAYYAFSAWVDTLDAPTATSSKVYIKLYRFLHLLSANLSKFVAAKFPAN